MVAGIVVLMALLTIMDVTLQNTTHAFSQVDATQRARPAFTSIENELHSACFADEETPIQSGSGPNALIFLTSTGTAATPTELWHEIDFNAAPANTLDRQHVLDDAVVDSERRSASGTGGRCSRRGRC